jgi:hypothetical protein
MNSPKIPMQLRTEARIDADHGPAARSSFAPSLVPNQSLIATSKEVIEQAIRAISPEFRDNGAATIDR